MMNFLMITFILLFIAVLPPDDLRHTFVACVEEDDPCRPASCSPTGPVVRFPFRLKPHQPERCGYPGFDLACGPTNAVEFSLNITIRATKWNIPLPIPSRVTVREIDYAAQSIGIVLLNTTCLPARLTQVIDSPSTSALFEVDSADGAARDGYTLFNCSEKPEGGLARGPLACLARGDGFEVYPVRSSVAGPRLPSSCTKMYDISGVPEAFLNGPGPYLAGRARLRWSEPDCGRCEADRLLCGLIANGRGNGTECFESPEQRRLERVVAIAFVSCLLIAVIVSTAFIFLCR